MLNTENDDVTNGSLVFKTIKCEFIKSCKFSKIICETFKVSKDTHIYIGNSVLYKGSILLLNKFLCVNYINNLPVFGKSLYFFH